MLQPCVKEHDVSHKYQCKLDTQIRRPSPLFSSELPNKRIGELRGERLPAKICWREEERNE